MLHIPNRLYQNWSYRIIDIEAPNLSDFDPGEASEKLVQDMLNQLLYLGSFLSKNAKASKKVPYKDQLLVVLGGQFFVPLTVLAITGW